VVSTSSASAVVLDTVLALVRHWYTIVPDKYCQVLLVALVLLLAGSTEALLLSYYLLLFSSTSTVVCLVGYFYADGCAVRLSRPLLLC
jgi:hypothetical protein